MSKVLVGIVIAAVVGAALFGVGLWIGRAFVPQALAGAPLGFGPGGARIGAYGPGGMMGGRYADGSVGPGVMGGRTYGQHGMMGGWSWSAPTTAEPLSIEDARAVVEAYLDRLGDDDLHVGEVMIFENHAYAEVQSTATGTGAFEVLVDPVSKAVFLEFGPAMMWNTEYGMMGGRGHGMMGGGFAPGAPYSAPAAEAADVDAEEASALAQTYLDDALPGVTVSEEVDVFPGYFTLHTLRDGDVVGMLSVNAFTGQVWYHTWHGDFVEMSE